MKRTRKTMSAAEREFKDRFDEEVRAKRPILVAPERVSGIVDCHHVLPKQVLTRHDRFRFLEPEELWAVRWDPDNGVPCDRVRHDQITGGMPRILPSELRPENIDFARRHDLIHRLRVECPLLELVEHE